MDSQSLRAADKVAAGSRGWDGGKKVGGRKRHLAVDCAALLLVVHVTPAAVQDRGAAVPVLSRLRELHRKTAPVWADGGYAGGLGVWARNAPDLALTVVKRSDGRPGVVVLPRRWVVERTLARLMHRRRLVRDYERVPAHPRGVVVGRRLARRPGSLCSRRRPLTRLALWGGLLSGSARRCRPVRAAASGAGGGVIASPRSGSGRRTR
ncbi:transposase [Streptomyces sp. NBC_01278]|uniref:transposase n=1 Tax=Streptomyces sp. NBC_01205 TaxID=2903771 RepID=UPI002E0D8004|nr:MULTISPECIES: transposase [unclassified Streptomyces]WSR28722.1 transposase [Streptomyces sp. NBC_01205]